jgi:hypothetical protein
LLSQDFAAGDWHGFQFLNGVACPNLEQISFDSQYAMDFKQVQRLFPYDETAGVLDHRRSTMFSSVTDIVVCLSESKKTVRFEEIKSILNFETSSFREFSALVVETDELSRAEKALGEFSTVLNLIEGTFH